MSLSIVEGPYLQDILTQPGALDATLTGLDESKALRSIAAKLKQGKFRSIVLTGMGGSFHALHPASLVLVNHGVTALMVETSELIHHQRQLLSPKNLVVAVSQSGQSAEIVRLMQFNRGNAQVIAVTNSPDSPLARGADAVLRTLAGAEFSVSCKTYLTALMVLRWLSEILTEGDLKRSRRELSAAVPLVRDYLRNWRQNVEEVAALLGGADHMFLVGRGASLAAVGTGALVIKESDHFHAEGMSSAAFRHGPLEMLGDNIFVVVFAGEKPTRKLNLKLWRDIHEGGGRSELLGEDSEFVPFRLPRAPASIRPILEILPVQMVTLALAALSGREAGRFTYATKVTTTE